MTTNLGAKSTADDVLSNADLADKRFLVTGASSGIGLEAEADGPAHSQCWSSAPHTTSPPMWRSSLRSRSHDSLARLERNDVRFRFSLDMTTMPH